MSNPKNIEIDLKKDLILESQIKSLEKILSIFQISLSSDICGILIINNQGEIISYNDEFLKIWTIPNITIVDGNLGECQFYLEKQLEDESQSNKLLETKCNENENSNVTIFKLKNGNHIAQTLLLQKLKAQTIDYIWFFWDISKLTELLNQKTLLERANYQNSEIIQETDSIKTIFFSKLCHQFRSLLNVISFANSLLKRSLSAQKDRQNYLFFTNNIQAGVEEINQLLEELVFYGKLETGTIKYKPSLVDLNLHCKKIVEQAQKIASKKQQTVNLSNYCNFKIAYLDEKLLEPTLNYLLSNAIKYSSENSTIILKISCQEQKIIFQVEDRGIGIDQKDLPKLFEPFFRGNNVANVKGNGIGLTIVENLVKLQGGLINISSQIGIGTTFTIILPFIKS